MGFSANSLGRLNLEIGYTVDKSGLNQIQNSLSDLITKSKMFGPNIASGMKEASVQVKQLTGLLASATNAKTGALDMSKFSTGLVNSGMSLNGLRQSLNSFGNEGATTFSTLNKQLLSANTTMTKTEGIAAQLGKTFMNTFMYSFSYRIVGSFIQGVSNAITYVKDLDKALTDIRIVTKESRSEMEKFAEKANTAAKNLGVSTKAYTEASLIFTQQGLKGKERDVRTETTMKVANVTGDDAAQVSQNLTAVWNGYKISSEQAEAAIDKLANVAAHSASNLAELSTGMSKVASAANSMGVSEDQLVSQLATIESVTRQAPESIGTALKTIYARMGDLQVKGTDEFGTSLGEVSGKLQQMGVDILDQEGNMKDMGVVMEEVAGKWDTWTNAQQQAAAVAMAGKRQYNNLISLFSNWDKYQENMQYSQNSEGQIEAQQQIYLDSIEGVKGKMQAAWEEVYTNLFDADTMKGFYEMITGIADAIGNLGDALPLAAFVMLGNVLKNQIVTGVSNWTLGLTKAQQQTNFLKVQQDAINNAYRQTVEIDGQRVFTNKEIVAATKAGAVGLGQQLTDRVLINREEVSLANSLVLRREIQSGLTEEEQEQFQALANQEAAQSRIIAQEAIKLKQNQNILALKESDLNLSNDNAVAAVQIGEAYENAIPILTMIEEKGSSILEKTNNVTVATGSQWIPSIKEAAASIEGLTLNEEQVNAIVQTYIRLVRASKGDVDALKQAVENLKASWSGTAANAKAAGAAFTGAQQGKNTMAQQAQNAQLMNAAYMGLTNTLFGASMAAMSFTTLWKTINDPDTSGIEKASAVLMHLGMVIMSVSQTVKGVKALMGTVTKTAVFDQAALNEVYSQYALEIGQAGHAELQHIAIKEAENGATVDGIRTKMLEAECLQGLSVEKKQEIVDTYLNTGAMRLEKTGRQGGIAMIFKEMAARMANIALKIKELALAHPYITAIVAIVAVIGALILAYANSTTKQQEHVKALQESQKEVYKTSEALKEMTDKYEDLKSSLSDLEDEYTVLETLRQGTQEWDDQVLKLNGHVADLLAQYPQLAEGLYTDENGVLRFKESAIKKTTSGIAQGIEKQQQTLLDQQANSYNNEKIVLADDMSDIIESNPDLKIGAEYSEEMMNAINDTTVKTVSDLKNNLKQQGVPVNKSQAASLFSLLQEARAKDNQKIALLKQSANIAKKNSDINFNGKGKTKEEKEENKRVKEDIYTNWYARAKSYIQDQKKKDIDEYDGVWDRSDEYLSLNIQGNTDYTGDEDTLLKGEKATVDYKKLTWVPTEDYQKDYFAGSVARLMPSYLQPYITEDFLKNDVGFKSTQDFDILHIASEKTGINRSQLKWDDDKGVVQVGKEDEAVTGFAFDKDDQSGAFNMIEDYFIDKVLNTALDKFLEDGLHISDIDNKLGRIASKYDPEKKKKSDYEDMDVSDIRKDDWDTTKRQKELQDQIDKETDKKKKKQLQEELDLIKSETDTVGAAAKEKIMGIDTHGGHIKGLYDDWNASVQAAYDTGNINVAQSNEMNDMVEQVRDGLKKTNNKSKTGIEKAYDKLAKENSGEIDNFTKALKSIDWSKPLDIDSIKRSFEAYGVNVEKLDLDWQKIAEEAKKITTQTADLAGNLEKYNQVGTTFLSLIEGLKAGDTISKEDYESALKDAANQEDFQKSFAFDARKKRYIYLGTDAFGNPDPSKSGIKKAMMGSGAENAITSAKKITTQFEDQNVKDKKGSDINLTDDDYDKLKFDKQKSKDNKAEYHNDIKNTAVDLVQKAYQNKKTGAYKTLEEMGGGNYKDMLKEMREGHLFETDKKGNVTGWADGMYEKYGEDYKNWLKATREMQTGIEKGSYDPTKTGTLSTALQTDSAGVTDMFSKINTYATEAKYSPEQKEQKHSEALSALQAQAAASAEALGGTTLEEANFTAALDRANPKIKEQSDLLLEAAGSATYNLMKGVEKLSGLFTDTYKDVQKGTTQYYQMLNDVAATANDAFGTNLIDEGFVDKNLGLFKKMAKGSKSAMKEIQLEILKTNKKSLGIKFTGLDKTQSQFWGLVKSLQNANVSIDTNLNTVEFFRQLAAAIAQMKGMTVGQMNEIFSNMSISLEWDAGVSDDTKTKDLNITDKKGNYNTKKNNKLIGGFKVVDKNANFSGAAAAGAKNDKSGGSGSNASNYTYETIEENDIDKLHDLKQAFEDLNHTLEQYKKQQDRTFGQGYIDNLNKQNEYIKKQNKNLKAQARILAKELAQDQFDMKKLYGFRFDKDGRIKNYSKVINKAYNKYKKLADEYNKMSAKKQNSKSGKNLKADLDKEKEYWQKRKDLVSKYDEKFNDRQSKINQLIDNYNEISDNNLKKLHAMSEAVEKTNEIQKVYLDYQKDILHSSKDRLFAAQYNVKSFQLNKKQLVEDKKELKELNKELKEFKKKGISKKNYLNTKGVVDATLNSAKKNLEDIKNLQQNLLDTIKALVESWKDYAEQVDKVVKKYDALSNSLKTYEEITKLLYGDDEYETFANINKEEYILQRSRLNVNFSRRSAAETNVQNARKAYNDALNVQNKSPEAIQELKDAVTQAEEELASIDKDIETSFKETATALMNIYTNTINNIFKVASENLTSGYGWDTISESLKRDKQYSDDWLDDAQKIGNIAQLTATFEQEIAKAVDYSASSQQKLLQCKQEELAALKQIDKLTQADIDRVRAKLSLTLKQIALEEARENKSKLRLKRDSQGNYSYQYSADQEAIAKAKEEYEAARLKLSEDSQKELFSLMSSRQQIEQEMIEKTKKLYEELGQAQKAGNKEEEERIRQEIADVVADGTKRLQHNESAIDRWTGHVYEDNLGYFNEKNNTNYSSIEEAQKYDKNRVYEFFWGEEGLIPSSTTGFMSMNHSTNQFITKFNQAFEDGDKAVEELSDGIEELGKVGSESMKTIITGSGSTKGLVNATQQTETFEKEVDKLTTAFKKTNTEITSAVSNLAKMFSSVNTKDFKDLLEKSSTLANNFEKVKTNMQDFINLVLNNAGNVANALANIKAPSTNALTGVQNIEGKAAASKKNNKGSGSGGSGSGGSGSGGSDYSTPTGPGDPGFSYGKKKSFKGKNGKKYYYYEANDGKYYTKDKKHSFDTLKELKQYVQPVKTSKKYGNNAKVKITKKKNSNKYKIKVTNPVTGKTTTFTRKSLSGAQKIANAAQSMSSSAIRRQQKIINNTPAIKYDTYKGVQLRSIDGGKSWQYYNPKDTEWHGTKKGTNYKTKKSAGTQGKKVIKKTNYKQELYKGMYLRSFDGGKTWFYYNSKDKKYHGTASSMGTKGYKSKDSAVKYGTKAQQASYKKPKAKKSAKKLGFSNNVLRKKKKTLKGPGIIDTDDVKHHTMLKRKNPKKLTRYYAYKWNNKKSKWIKDKGFIAASTELKGGRIYGLNGNYVLIAFTRTNSRSGVKTKYKKWFNKTAIQNNFKGFDTGGYTGIWNNKNGKLALLHEKEIVLNKQDTANFLEAVKLTRSFAADLSKYKTGITNQISSLDNNTFATNTQNTDNVTKQNININASFPNATNSSEIEKAFQQLSAKATQYAWSNKIK